MASDPTLTRKEPRLGPAPSGETPPRPHARKSESAPAPEARPAAKPDARLDDAADAPKKVRPKPLPPSKIPQIRLLPVTIFVAVLMLSVKVNDIWRGISLTTQSRAQQAAAPAQRSNQTAATTPAQAAPPAQQQNQAPGVQPAPTPARSGSPVATTPSADGSEATFTQTEIDVLQKLAARRSHLEGRSKELDGREALLKAAESRIDKKITEMKTLQGTIEGLLRQYNDQEDTKMKSLVKIYENMKPKDAAKIFEQLDMPIMLDVIERMKEAKVAPIMAEMDPSKAMSLTSELAHRRQIPVPKPQQQ